MSSGSSQHNGIIMRIVDNVQCRGSRKKKTMAINRELYFGCRGLVSQRNNLTFCPISPEAELQRLHPPNWKHNNNWNVVLSCLPVEIYIFDIHFRYMAAIFNIKLPLTWLSRSVGHLDWGEHRKWPIYSFRWYWLAVSFSFFNPLNARGRRARQ